MDLGHGLQLLGVSPSDLSQIRKHPQAVEVLAKLQQEAKSRYKKLVLELHPDRTGGDETKTKLFNEVTRAHKWLQELRLEPAHRTFRQITIYIPFGRGVRPSVDVVTATVRPRKYDARRVAFLRVD
jgi:hypothetical protein